MAICNFIKMRRYKKFILIIDNMESGVIGNIASPGTWGRDAVLVAFYLLEEHGAWYARIPHGTCRLSSAKKV